MGPEESAWWLSIELQSTAQLLTQRHAGICKCKKDARDSEIYTSTPSDTATETVIATGSVIAKHLMVGW